jgi:long-chain acyl-CoA synthetase
MPCGAGFYRAHFDLSRGDAKLGVPILPVLIEGTFEALPKGTLLPRRRSIRVVFGSVLDPIEHRAKGESQSEREICQAIASEIEQKIQGLREQGE